MAKLSVHGYEVARFKKTQFEDRMTDLGYTMNHTFYYSIRSDGHILKKQTILWQDGQFHSYGFKLFRKAKAGTSSQDVIKLFESNPVFERITT